MADEGAGIGAERRRGGLFLRLVRRAPFGAFWPLAALTSLAWYGAIAWFTAPPELRAPSSLPRVLALPLAASGITLAFLLVKWRQRVAERRAGRR